MIKCETINLLLYLLYTNQYSLANCLVHLFLFSSDTFLLYQSVLLQVLLAY